MARRRKNRDGAFKARVALEAVKERETASALAKRFQVHPTQIQEWKRRLVEQAATAFEKESVKPAEGIDPAELYEQIGRLKVELEFVKKKLPSSKGYQAYVAEREKTFLAKLAEQKTE